MGKRILALILMAVMMLTMGAQAVDTFAVKDTISLSFDGTTAICSATCKGSNTDDKVKATLTLVSEGKTVASWSASDSYSASISESCEVVQGKTYTLKLNYSINGTAKDAAFTNTELNSTYTFYVIKNY